MVGILAIVFGIFSLIPVEGRLMCFDQKTEIDKSWEVTGNSYKYVGSTKNLPVAIGRISPTGNNVWYVEGSGAGKEIKISSAADLYSDRARSVQIYIRYFDKSPRRASLLPIKGTLPLVTIPASSGSDWSEARFDINPRESPIEISSYLSQGQYILFDKIVLAVDSSVPANVATASCSDLMALSPEGSSPTGSRSPPSSPLVTRAAGSGGPAGPGSTAATSTTKLTPGECASSGLPTECKCNCLCNCAKC